MLLVYLPAFSRRCQYVFDLVLGQHLGVSYTLTTDLGEFEQHPGARLEYGPERKSGAYFVRSADLLWEDTIQTKEVPVGHIGPLPVLFPTPTSTDLEFDLFAATFYMVSRYEEYLPSPLDLHGRFNPKESIAYQNGFLEIPVVDQWIIYFGDALGRRYPELTFKKPQFNAILTYDVDVAYKFRGRGIFRQLGSALRDFWELNFQNLAQRIQTIVFQKPDPWDTYTYLREAISQSGLRSIFFFLVGDRSAQDRNLDIGSGTMKQLVNHMSHFSQIGIHPSYCSSEEPQRIFWEKQRLESLSGSNIKYSRQHFLKFTLPNTYLKLIDAGIQEEYSMGFPYVAGFRAGTSHPFLFYDLSSESITPLKVYPVTFMEGNFLEKSPPDPDQAILAVTQLIEMVHAAGGTFVSIWHNHTVSQTPQYIQWRRVHEAMLRKLEATTLG
ncbi:MAG: polysaccharide deacetylase family protein [Bacteroidota bacterium]|nr:polysaccharide deacetylase family protein [Bacteroidota bacterium]